MENEVRSSCRVSVTEGTRLMAQGQDMLLGEYPDWVPDAARHYLAHTEKGTSIRALARAADCHASTILRQVRRFEGRRDDPLVDDALKALAIRHAAQTRKAHKEHASMKQTSARQIASEETGAPNFDQEALRILRRLCEGGAVLAVAREMEMAVVVRDGQDGSTTRTAVAPRDIAQALALRGWISCTDPSARIIRYHITPIGRTALKQLRAETENKALDRNSTAFGSTFDEDTQKRSYGLGETPLAALARRRDRDGRPFLTRELVAVGERLREDFELANLEQDSAIDWTEPSAFGQHVLNSLTDPKARVLAALSDLGPGLGDVVLRCCCFLEGLETAEKNMGWAARSGKIVLRIALQRLKRHYEDQGKFGPKIG